MDEFCFATNGLSLLESCQLRIIAKYKASNFCKIEPVIQRCSAKKVSQKSCKIQRKNHFAECLF